MSTLPSLRALLIDELKDLFHAEQQLLKALPRMVKAATSVALKAGLTAHLRQTRAHVVRLTEALRLLGRPAKGKPSQAMLGLLKEGADVILSKGPPAVRDAALIGAAQRVDHYEMAGYGTARTFAQVLGEKQVAALLQETLDEEGSTDREFTEIAATVNAEALAASPPRAAS